MPGHPSEPEAKAVDVTDVPSDLFILRACQVTFAPITDPISWLKRCASGSRLRGPRRLTLSPAAVGERLLRELHREASGRTAERRNPLHFGGSKGDHRELAPALHHGVRTHPWATGPRTQGSDISFQAATQTNPELTSHPHHRHGGRTGARSPLQHTDGVPALATLSVLYRLV